MKARHFASGFFSLLWLGCPRPQDKATPGPAPAPLPAAPTSWCDSINGYMKGFECLTLAGEVDLASFGPARDQLSEGTLASCFGGKLPGEIPVKTQAAMLPTYSQDWSSQLDSSTGLDLQRVSSWLPSATLKGDRSRAVKVEISFESLERLQVSDVALAFRSKIAGSTAKSTLGRLDSCRKRLCKANYLTAVEVLRGYPKITITSDAAVNLDSQAGWESSSVDLGVNVEGGNKRQSKLVMQRAKDAGPVVVAARLVSLAESMSSDNLCADDAMSAAGSEARKPSEKPVEPPPPAVGPPPPADANPALEARRAVVTKLLAGESEPKSYSDGSKTWKIGDKLSTSQREEVLLMNLSPVSSADGKRRFQLGDTCTLDAGASLQVVGFYKEGLFTEALVKYSGAGGVSYACPPGALFFRFF